MTRIPDPSDPQPGDRFVNPRYSASPNREIVARDGLWCWVRTDNGLITAATNQIAADYRPVLSPLITEPVILHHRAGTDPKWWWLTVTDMPMQNNTGRRFELKPWDNSAYLLTEVTS